MRKCVMICVRSLKPPNRFGCSNQFGAQEPGSDAEIKAFAAGKGAKVNRHMLRALSPGLEAS